MMHQTKFIEWLEKPIALKAILDLEYRLGIKMSNCYIQFISNFYRIKNENLVFDINPIPYVSKREEIKLLKILNFEEIYSDPFINADFLQSSQNNILFADVVFAMPVMVNIEKKSFCDLSMCDTDFSMYKIDLTIDKFLSSLRESPNSDNST